MKIICLVQYKFFLIFFISKHFYDFMFCHRSSLDLKKNCALLLNILTRYFLCNHRHRIFHWSRCIIWNRINRSI